MAVDSTGPRSPGRASATHEDRDSLFARFMAAHLTTDVERAVFWVLAGSSTQTWTATAVAREAQISDHQADQALRRFTAAAILERVDEPGRPRRYRWRAEMSYLHNASESPAGRIDPVCGMPVPDDSPHVAADDDGHEIAFCSLPCLVRWRTEHRRRRHGSPATRTTRPST